MERNGRRDGISGTRRALRRAEEPAESALRHASSLLDAISDSVITVDVLGRITFFNQGAEASSGRTREEVIGKPIFDFVPTDQRDVSLDVGKRLLGGEEARDVLVYGVRRTGERFPSRATAVPVRDDDGEIVAFAMITRDVSHQIQMEESLAASEARFRSPVQHASEAAFIIDVDGSVLYVAEAAERVFGVGLATFESTMCWDWIHPDDHARLRAQMDAAIAAPGEQVEVQVRSHRGAMWVEVTLTSLVDDPVVGGIVANVRDITDRLEAAFALAASEARFRGYFEHAAVGHAMTSLPSGTFIEANDAYCQMTGYQREELLTMRYLDLVHPDDRDANMAMSERLLRGETQSSHLEERYVRHNGEETFVANSVSVIRDADGMARFMASTVEDISERRRMERELEHLALHDSLTGLPNRALLHDRLEHAVERAARGNTRLAVIFVDVDHFKAVNDSRGHSAGDELLCGIAARLSEALRDADTIARFGGDEFVVVCDGIVDKAHALAAGERIIEAFGRPIALRSGDVYATVSVGAAVSDSMSGAEQLLRNADSAMYRAKERGRARVELFDDASPDRAEARLSIAAGLHRALENDELAVVYQPFVRITDGRILGAEALVRWDHPQHGRLSPAAFIPVAEETGLVTRVGAFVLREACRQLASWREIDRYFTVGVNVSRRQLADPGFVPLVEQTAGEYGVPLSALCVEVIELAALNDIDQIIGSLSALRAAGVRIALDDFGTGCSSLRNLRRLPVDAVKVDREFIEGLPHDAYNRAFLAAMFTLAASLDLVLAAEGIETAAQRSALQRLGFTYGQGFHFAEPLDATTFRELLERRARLGQPPSSLALA